MSTGASLNRHRSKQDYQTPRPFLGVVKEYLQIREFTHDYAADVENAVCTHYWDETHNSLDESPERWAEMSRDGWGWLNPPFGNIEPWAQRCAQSAVLGANIAFLVPASVGADWFLSFVHQKAMVLFLNGRLSFNGLDPYPKDCMLCLYGPHHVYNGYAVLRWPDWITYGLVRS